MTDAVEEATYISMSKNSAIDAVINEKMLLAQKSGIATHFQVESLEQINVPSMDICTILSNALDNAIEANVKVEKMSDRYIETKITNDESGIFISIKNPSPEAPKKRAGNYISSKTDKENHGLGLKSIKRTVDKHKGDMLIKYENEVFTIIVNI